VIASALKTLFTIWTDGLLGAVLTVSTTWLGWQTGRRKSFPPVQAIGWWVKRIVVPLLRCSSWSRRTAIIFLNNATVLAIIVAVGRYPYSGMAAAAALGASLGIALRVLADASFGLGGSTDRFNEPQVRWRLRIGLTLNMLEPPAIVVAVGLSFARGSQKIPAGAAWETFAVVVMPALLIAAAGEALWLGVTTPAPAAANGEAKESTWENV